MEAPKKKVVVKKPHEELSKEPAAAEVKRVTKAVLVEEKKEVNKEIE